MPVTFWDETQANVLPPGVFVQIYPQGQPFAPQNLEASGYLDITGSIAQSIDGAVPYTAVFTGTQAPTSPINFMGDASNATTSVTVTGYRSPSLSQLGYTAEQMNLWVNRIFGDSARAQGGNAYALAYGLAAILSQLDSSTQQVIAGDRVQTCAGSQLDSWAFDFFGKYLLRYPYESDAIYYSRIITAFGPRCTLFAIQTIVQQYYVATSIAAQQSQTQNISFDTTGSYDVRGGFDIFATSPPSASLVPVVTVWDSQSNPGLAATYSIAVPQFVIQIAFSPSAAIWYLDHGHLDIETVLASANAITTSTTPPNAQVGALVNLAKSGGTTPIYQVYST